MTDTAVNIRAMSAGDLDWVIDLDRQAGGMRREDFFRRRWRAMESDPDAYIALVAGDGDTVSGFALGHVLTGEFGVTRPLAIIDGIAVDAGARGGGVGTALLDAFKGEAKDRECAEVRTMADWGRQDLLAFFAGTGFSLAPLNVLERSLETN